MTAPTVQIEFEFHGTKQEHVISIQIATETLDINEIAADAINSNTSFGYSGRHDHGQLPQLQSDPQHANIISSIQEARKACDEYLTKEMEAQSNDSRSGNGRGAQPPAEKRPRLADDGVTVGMDSTA